MLTLDDAWNSYLSTRQLTRAGYLTDVSRYRVHLGPYWHGKNLASIRTVDVQRFTFYLYKKGIGHQTVKLCLSQIWKEDRRKTRGRYDLTSGDKKGLLASSRMYQIISEDKLLKGTSELDGFTWTVDTKGTVLFKLPSGGLIRDSGSELTYSVSDPVSRAAALRLAKMKFGRDVREAGNMFQRESGARLEF